MAVDLPWLVCMLSATAEGELFQEPTTSACFDAPALEIEDAAWSWEYQVSLWSQYVWRGVVLNDEPVLQPEFFLYRGFEDGSYFGAGLFWSMDLSNVADRQGEVSELDYCAEWGIEGESATIAVGAASYTYPGSSDPSTVEFYLSCQWPQDLVTPQVELWSDLLQAHGFYLRGALLREFALSEHWMLCAQTWASAMDRNYADYNVGARAAGFSDAGAQLQLCWMLQEGLRLDLAVYASMQIESAYRDALDDPDPIWFGLFWSQEF